ncbi:MAG: MAPEG family protein [Ignavibacteriales bacterium]
METHTLTAAVTLVSLLVYFWLGLRVGRGRSLFGVAAPATTGHPDFERLFRAHQNTLEWLPLYLASLWLFAFYVSEVWAAALGLVWIVGRVLYGVSYAKAAEARSTGFGIQALATAVLLFGALIGVVRVWIVTH